MSHNVKLTIITVLIILVLGLAGIATYLFVFKKATLLTTGPEVATFQDLKNGTYKYFFEGEVIEINPEMSQIRVKGTRGSVVTFQVYAPNFADLAQRPATTDEDVPTEAEIAEEIRRYQAGEITLPTAVPDSTPPLQPISSDISYTKFLGAIENLQATSLDQVLKIGDQVTVTFIINYPPAQIKADDNKFIGPAEIYLAESIKK